jgi:UPF0271 protein
MTLEVQPFTESSVRIVFSNEVNGETTQRIASFCRRLRHDAIIDIVPAYLTATVFFDSERVDHDALIDHIHALSEDKAVEHEPPACVAIPVVYDGEDLDWLSGHTGLSESEIIKRHCAPDYRVCMLGFAPGFPYLSGMDRSLSAPRLDHPRVHVAAGSVGIAGEQTGIYPFDTPGGWRIIGRSPLLLFDPSDPQPALIQPGMILKFECVSKDCFDIMDSLLAAGQLTSRELAVPSRSVDLNCDIGEGADDAAIMDHITSVNISCGFHAGSDALMRSTMDTASERGLCIGAHPGFADPDHFGRRELDLDPSGIRQLIIEQVGPFLSYAATRGISVQHVKPHGALYNMAARDPDVAGAIANAIHELDPRLRVMALSGSQLIHAAEAQGLVTISEVFADREYDEEGCLVSRSEADAVLADPIVIAERALTMVRAGGVRVPSGSVIRLRADSICLHSDTEGAAEHAAALRGQLSHHGIQLRGVTR